ncbi:MAG: hypothetical protein ABJK39_04240 [Hyphomicrobiales bacterium]
MTKLQATMTIAFALSILVFVFAGQATIGSFILAAAMFASVTTVLHGLALETRLKQVADKGLDQNWS